MGSLTLISNSEDKLLEYRELLRLPELLRQPLRKAESTTEDLASLVVEKCESAMEYVDPPFLWNTLLSTSPL